MGPRRMGPPPEIAFVTMPREVYDKLGLTADEQTKVDEIRKKVRQETRSLMPRPQEGQEPPSQADMEANHEKAKKLIDAAEQDALAALSSDHKDLVVKTVKHMKTLQAAHLPAGAVLDLNLTDDQYAKLDALAPAKGEQVDGRALHEKAIAILTDDQKQTLQDFMASQRDRGGRGGPDGGGPGGPGGPGGGGMGGPGDGGPGGPPPDGGNGPDNGGGNPPPPPDSN